MSYPSIRFSDLKMIADEHTSSYVHDTASGRMLFTEYGARLLGLYPLKDLPNTLWVPERLDRNMSDGSWAVGGERLWVAPERNFFYDNPRDFEGFNVPADMDPGDYAANGNLIFENNFSILNYNTNETYEDCYAKRAFSIIDDPYGSNLAYAGVRIEDTMILDTPDLGIAGWSLAQIYTCGPEHPGTALFPVKKHATILSYFNPIPPIRADVRDGYARFRIDAAKIFKFAIRPEDMVFDNLCKVVYLSPYPDSDKWFCLIKRSDDMARSQAECVDPAKGNPDGPMGAIQSYNHGPSDAEELDAFGEIELQLSKGVPFEGRMMSRARHELLSYAGSKAEMLELAKQALGIDELPHLYDR